MSKIVCSKCGATGNSKCPYCRTVFPDNQLEALLSYVIQWDRREDRIVVQVATLTTSVEEALTKTLSALTTCAEKVGFAQYACEHDWVFAEGQHSEIACCHRKGA